MLSEAEFEEQLAEVQALPGYYPSSELEFNNPLEECTDVQKLQKTVEFLWGLLDDIDTVSDMVKSNDVAYRKLVEKLQCKRFEVVTSDGYDLFLKIEVVYG